MEIVMSYILSNGREIVSEVLMKLEEHVLSDLPMACKTCPDALWQITGKASQPHKVQVRCYCPMMHAFTWDAKTQEEILDCEHLYDEEEDVDSEVPPVSEENLPPHVRAQREAERLRLVEQINDRDSGTPSGADLHDD
ncbi:hypothetical protein [Pseudomonas fragariae (ex Marin et al. 2024)]|uniref:hypothetical protein n=1 Tax=Pseudomonas fragariae (ex Marin et al. 2024) TaxID=3080056 RepID=UPI003F79E4C6